MNKVKAAIAVYLLLSSAVVEARIVTWLFSGAQFSDGAIATGSFTFDSSTALFLADFDIETAEGNLPAARYTPATIISLQLTRNELILMRADRVLDLQVSEAFFDSTFQPIIPEPVLPLNNFSNEHTIDFSRVRLLRTGSIAGVPEASNSMLLVVGMIGLCLGLAAGRAHAASRPLDEFGITVKQISRTGSAAFRPKKW